MRCAHVQCHQCQDEDSAERVAAIEIAAAAACSRMREQKAKLRAEVETLKRQLLLAPSGMCAVSGCDRQGTLCDPHRLAELKTLKRERDEAMKSFALAVIERDRYRKTLEEIAKLSAGAESLRRELSAMELEAERRRSRAKDAERLAETLRLERDRYRKALEEIEAGATIETANMADIARKALAGEDAK